jgi:hypothetical protein
MSNVNGETVDRAALRADLRGFVGKLAESYGFGLALLTFGVVVGGILAWLGFQAWIATSAGFWYLTSSYVAAAVGAFALAFVWAAVKLLRFVGRRAEEEDV